MYMYICMYTCTEMYACLYTYGHVHTFIMHIKMNIIELQPRKVDLICAYSKNAVSILHITMKPVFFPIKTSVMAVIFIS